MKLTFSSVYQLKVNDGPIPEDILLFFSLLWFNMEEQEQMVKKLEAIINVYQ